jgi:mono/diheme cytochrome c family protein
MTYQKLFNFFAIVFWIAFLPQWANAIDLKNGKELFGNNCASCHNGNMKDKSTGPALYDVQNRWKEYPGDLYKWIRNSVDLAASGNPKAMSMIDWSASAMTAFENLEDAEIDDILAYIQQKGEFGCIEPPCGGVSAADPLGPVAKEPISPLYGYTLLAFLLVSVALLGRYINSLNRLSQQNAGMVVSPEKSFMAVLLGPRVVKLLIFALVLFGGYSTVNNAIGLGRQQGYEPSQPIKFSHKTHAGDNGIDCQYCHDGARRSKHSVIPASNTCINCHAEIQKGSKDGTQELIKVYAASGFNPANNSYLPEDMSEEERAEVYKNWLKDLYSEDRLKNESEVDKMIAEQVASVMGTYNKPIEWIRIHNLPDHVYFNHAQHVSVGKIKCETCHGEVSEMEVVKQHSPLSMGWCINCHRQTEVQFKGNLNESEGSPYAGDANKANKYYSKEYGYYEKYHNEIKDKTRKGVTVEEIGGLECQKCHY